MKINIVLFWFGRNVSWGQGRTYQKVAEHLAEIPEVDHVVCLFKPKEPDGSCFWPFYINRLSRKLILLIPTIIKNVPGISAPYRLRYWINGAIDNFLKLYLKILGFRKDNTILWLFPPHPYLEKVIELFPHRLIVGHIVDNFTKLSEEKWTQRQAEAQYPKIERKSDLIITGSKFNHQLFNENHKYCYLFENAVDKMFIAKPSGFPCMESNNQPTLGYIGTISPRTDVELLQHIAISRPDWSIIIAGEKHLPHEELINLLGLQNVHYLGVVPYRELPSLLKSFDVCLMPHKDTEYSRSMSPLKLFQYLASGRPIVATNIAGLDSMKEYIEIASSNDEFLERIEYVLKKDTIDMSKIRIQAAKKETWDIRVGDMFERVKDRFIAKRV